MKKIYSLLLTIALAIGFTSCGDNWEPPTPGDNGKGSVSLASMGVEVSTVEQTVSRAAVDLSSFIVIINNAAGEEVARWKYAEMPEVFALPVGDGYSVTVKSHEVEKAAWDKPYFLGTKTFDIKNNEITNIGVVSCAFANIKVTIKFGDALKAKLGDDAKVTVVANDQGRLEYTPDETRAGYFEALDGSSTLVAEFTGTIDGEAEPVTLRKVYTNVASGTHYLITFNISGGTPDIPDETGGVKLENGLKLDASVTAVDINANITLEEDIIDGKRPTEGEDPGPGPENPDDPQTPDAIKIESETLSFTAANDPSAIQSAVVNIHSESGVAHLLVHIESTSADFIASAGDMVPFDFDLAYPTVDGTDWSDMLGSAGLGFPVKDQVIGQKDVVFDITQFVPLLAGFPGTHKFTITVTDADNKQLAKTLTFIAK